MESLFTESFLLFLELYSTFWTWSSSSKPSILAFIHENSGFWSQKIAFQLRAPEPIYPENDWMLEPEAKPEKKSSSHLCKVEMQIVLKILSWSSSQVEDP